uniref:PA14 domain-containing protein n=1 Tax=Panagrellus redivivus TaxID=6233 RepID=A0A7E4VG93_PANRE
MRFICLFLTAFLAVAAGFDFDPREFLISAQSSPQVIDFDVAGSGSDTLDYTLPPSLDANSATDLLANANALSAKTEALLEQIDQLRNHFYNDSTGPDFSKIANLTDRLTVVQESLTSAAGKLGPIRQRQNDNSIALNKINLVLTCLAGSECSAGFNCSNAATTTRNVSGPRQSGQWIFQSFKEFDCDLQIVNTGKSGFWANLTLSNFNFNGTGGSLLVTPGSGSATNLTEDDTISDISGFPVTVQPIGQVEFTLSYVTYDPCGDYDCGNGTCFVKSDNTLGCKCHGCYGLDTNGTCGIKYDDPCKTYESYCTAVEGGKCETDDSCNYYCACPGVDSSCTTNKWCDGTSSCQAPKKFNAVQPQKKWWYWF